MPTDKNKKKLPKKYEMVYDGRCCIDALRDNIKEFVDKYGLKKKSRAFSGYSLPQDGAYHKVFDHSQLFLTYSGKYVYITSPYKPPYDEELAKKFGLEEYGKPLYASNAITLIKTFDNLKEWGKFKRYLRNFDKKV